MYKHCLLLHSCKPATPARNLHSQCSSLRVLRVETWTWSWICWLHYMPAEYSPPRQNSPLPLVFRVFGWQRDASDVSRAARERRRDAAATRGGLVSIGCLLRLSCTALAFYVGELFSVVIAGEESHIGASSLLWFTRRLLLYPNHLQPTKRHGGEHHHPHFNIC